MALYLTVSGHRPGQQQELLNIHPCARGKDAEHTLQSDTLNKGNIKKNALR